MDKIELDKSHFGNDKERFNIKTKDPSMKNFSEYLRKVYTFGCW